MVVVFVGVGNLWARWSAPSRSASQQVPRAVRRGGARQDRHLVIIILFIQKRRAACSRSRAGRSKHDEAVRHHARPRSRRHRLPAVAGRDRIIIPLLNLMLPATSPLHCRATS